ncbi:MAG: DUF5711 family protein [Gallicola sp.]|nr:DUF5711 family protein [Gallicola sp.]
MERIKKLNWKIPAIVLAIALMIFLAWVFFRTKTMTVAENIPVAAKDKMALTDDEILILKGNQLTAYNYDSKELWTKTVGLKNPVIAAGKDRIYLGEGRILLILDKKGDVKKQLDIPLDCKAMELDKEGLIVRSDVRQIVVSKEEIKSYISDEKVRMTDGSLSKKNDNIAFSSIELRDGRVLAHLTWTDNQGKVISKQSFFDEIPVYMNFFEEDQLLFATNENLYLLKGGVIHNQIGLNLIKGISVSEDRIYIMDLDDLVVYDKEFKLLDKIALKKDYKGIVAVKGGMILFHESGYGVYQTGSLKEESSEKPIRNAKVINNHIYLIHDDAVSRIY